MRHIEDSLATHQLRVAVTVEPILDAVQMKSDLEEAYPVVPVCGWGAIGESEPIKRRKDKLCGIVRL